MSQYPPSGPYGTANPQQPSQQQPQQQPPYHPQQQGPTSNYGPPQPAHKTSSTAALGHMINSGMNMSKPMLNKLGKTFGLSNKPSASTPQHLQNYQSYQDHYQQQNPTQPQGFSPQSAQQQQPQWQQPQPQQPQTQPPQNPTNPQQNTYPSPQQSPFPPSNYATPASGQSGQVNYFPPQQNPASVPQTPQPQPDIQGFNGSQFQQGQNGGIGQPVPQGYNQNQPQGQAYQGQQSGVISPPPQTISPSPQAGNAPSPFGQQQQQPWVPPTPSPGNVNISPAQHQAQPFTPTPPPQQYGGPQVPPQHTRPEQQWAPMSPTSPHGATTSQVPPSASPPPQAASQPGLVSPPPTSTIPQTGPTEFLAELPADLGNLSLAESTNPQRPPSNPPPQNGQYQAFQPGSTGQSNSPGQKYTLPRRAVSTSSLPLADPWRVADPVTELPTREFYIIADLLFDAIDRKFEPQNTGLLEASKILQSWRLQGIAEGVAELFEYNSYSAFAKSWSKKGIPHVLVPAQTALMPSWNFQAQTQSDEMKIPHEPPADNAPYPVYFPALNRAGWYKSLFQDLISEPESLQKLMPTLCGDTYKPGVLNQPDIQRHDKTPVPGLAARVQVIQAQVTGVCEEILAEIQSKQASQGGHAGPTAQGDAAAAQQAQQSLAEAQMAAQLKMQSLQMQQQINQQMNQQMVQGGLSMSMAAGNMYKPNYGGFV